MAIHLVRVTARLYSSTCCICPLIVIYLALLEFKPSGQSPILTRHVVSVCHSISFINMTFHMKYLSSRTPWTKECSDDSFIYLFIFAADQPEPGGKRLCQGPDERFTRWTRLVPCFTDNQVSIWGNGNKANSRGNSCPHHSTTSVEKPAALCEHRIYRPWRFCGHVTIYRAFLPSNR